ncbi:Rieske 2Fe-2S domain-containing protein [Geobacter sp. FeAm09]|uniref:QcrA and Rieske domain-containing protein n=1 Tax=Geobacter sp. FeAm09 TaxID=2597769 RepID=UPI0011EE34D9|nr:Rieske 2Fe-2S domain-containing protein [Geobacter sp. FeAm09]QEM67273.1 Rieske 2Fe-2S domain-containing protein [Geobacter sp. FeAm09]
MERNGRRTFLGVCLGGLAAAVAAVTAWPVYRYLAPRSTGATAARVDIPEKDVPEGEARFFEFNGASAVVVRKRGGGLIALSAVCTHLGCIVQWEKDKQDFLCPCHGGHYSPEGAVTAGPPPKPLTKLPFSVANGTITVG